MEAFLLIGVCLFLGALLPRLVPTPEAAPAGLNLWVLYAALPALLMREIPKLAFTSALAGPILGLWVVALGAWAWAAWIGRRVGWSRQTVGCVALTCGFGNTAFIGYALVPALLGPAALGPGIVADQFGSFMGLATLGAVMAAVHGGTHPSPLAVGRKLATYPPFLGFIAGGVARASGGWPPAIDHVLDHLALTLTPVALFSVGMQLRVAEARAHARDLGLGLAWKLVVGPLAVLALVWWLPGTGLTRRVGVVQAGMAPMISAGIVAIQAGLNPRLASAMTGVGILLSLITVPLWAGAAWLVFPS